MARFQCPKCEATFKPKAPPTPGKTVRCPECDHAFRPEFEEDAAISETPAKPVKRRDPDDDENNNPKKPTNKEAPKSNTMLFALVGGGVAVLVLGCCMTGVLGYVFWPKRDDGAGGGAGDQAGKGGPKNAANVSDANFKKIKFAAKRAEVEQIMGGPGDKIDVAEADTLLKKRGSPKDNRRVSPAISSRPDSSYFVWRNDDNHILVAFVNTKKYGDLAAFSDLCIKRGAGNIDGGVMFGPPNGVEQERDVVEKRLGFLSDPKWKKGPEARHFLVGAWGFGGGRPFDFEFRADGTMSGPGQGLAVVLGTYKFLDDERIETRYPGQTSFGRKMDAVTRKFLVSDNDLCLIDLLDNGEWATFHIVYPRRPGKK